MPRFTPDMTLLDIVAADRSTEAVFRARDEAAGECILCNALFDTLDAMTRRYALDLDALLADLEASVGHAPDPDRES